MLHMLSLLVYESAVDSFVMLLIAALLPPLEALSCSLISSHLCGLITLLLNNHQVFTHQVFAVHPPHFALPDFPPDKRVNFCCCLGWFVVIFQWYSCQGPVCC